MRTRSDAAGGTGTGPARRRDHPSPSRLQSVVVRALGLALGAALAAHALPSLEVAAGPAPLPLSASVSVIRSGEVGLADGGQLLVGAELRPGPGGEVSGRLQLVSETALPVNVSVQDVGSPIGLEDQLWVRVTLDGALVFEGVQARLRRSSSRSLQISPGESATIDVTVGLRDGADARSAGRSTEIKLQVLSPVVVPGDAPPSSG